MTSKTQEHAGYGLYLVRELCRRNGGVFLLVSGGAAYRIGYAGVPGGAGSQAGSIYARPVPWHGTLVAMQLHVDNPIDLRPIYNELPTPGGYTKEDRIDLFGA